MTESSRPAWLLDENFPEPAVAHLRASGWDVLAISDTHAALDDADVLSLALDEHRWLATFDRDFGDLIFHQKLPPPPLTLLLRVTSYGPEEPAQWIEQLFDQGQLHLGCFHIFDGRTVRRRPQVRVLG
ncbi:DUF5615 family PIN-like protein [Thiorhodovibrio frisius]|uniref:DUF5615 domain-containing protein n=1 Tax=Thiorhodovibrio frisius TaxID=631362 RepID=H8Z3V8_9GAMM|nr:DUF5615 family PIN-like protein [Thiorhodovibrio frisius]EIC21110.1 hypothetical protein Thi970DRAFT_04797 [Thiorhodovibrio frisius]WPL22170.1 hypothetical protein Thiofri_02328 [Thiorhodovibrio frisius]